MSSYTYCRCSRCGISMSFVLNCPRCGQLMELAKHTRRVRRHLEDGFYLPEECPISTEPGIRKPKTTIRRAGD